MDLSVAKPQRVAGREIYQRLHHNIERVVKGQSSAIRVLLAAFASGGHVLLEDYPGTGKTTLAKALACSVDVAFKRIQFTPDLLPSDILGISILDPIDLRCRNPTHPTRFLSKTKLFCRT